MLILTLGYLIYQVRNYFIALAGFSVVSYFINQTLHGGS